MRELKFRCWDEVNKNMIYCDFNSRINMVLSDLYEKGKVMQYTGLKTNEKEIYEGDIIENDAEWWVVEFSDGKFMCDPIKGGNVYFDLSELADSQETWVQGNRYEHPELLEE